MLMPLRGPRQSHAIGRTVRAPFRPPLHTRPSVEPRQLGRRPQAPHVIEIPGPLRIPEWSRELGSCSQLLDTTGSAPPLDGY